MAESAQEKTEQPTSRRLAEARKEGNVAKSPDLTAAVMLLAAVVLLYWLGMRLLEAMRLSLEVVLSGTHAVNLTRPDDLMGLAYFHSHVTLSRLVPFVLAITAVGVLVLVAQVGFLMTGKPLVPSFKKINPVSGVKKIFDKRALMRLGMSLGKVILIAVLCFWTIRRDLGAVLSLAEKSAGGGFAAGAWLVFLLALQLAVLLLILALLDFAFQKWQRVQDLKMTKQEIKEEMKNMDGDPQIKQRRARVARQLAMQRMAQAVPKADVIVTNPTHFSVAIQYDASTMRAPKVVAKGADFMAMRIRQIAALHEVPIVERKPLARALYAAVEVGQEIPGEHYAAVAELLAYVYRIGERKTA